ncbi:unnamed protein product [Phaeothamnion confervicola]
MFIEWLDRSAYLLRLSTSRPMSLHALAHLARRDRAEQLRRAPQSVSALLGGIEPAGAVAATTTSGAASDGGRRGGGGRSGESDGSGGGESGGGESGGGGRAVLYWLDSLGALQRVPYGAHGHASRFALSLLDKRYRPDMTEGEAVAVVRDSVAQLGQRYLINSGRFQIRVVDRNGCRDVGGC